MLLKDKNILLVEDGIDSQRFVKFVLEREGAIVTIVDNGTDAVKHVNSDSASKQPDLILMDINIPNLDGYATTTYLRARGFESPIAAFTSESSGGQRSVCMDVGCDAYLTKPISPDKLVASVTKFLASSSRA